VLITVTYAPDWAEGPGQDRALYEGTWKPDASAFNDFAHALAQRYSGTFGNLPRVRYPYWKAGARVAIQQPLRDLPGNPFYGSGLLFSDGRPKPACTAFSFPFVTDRRSHRRVFAWGKSPAEGTVKIQVRKGHRGWKTLKRRSVKDGEVFKAPLRLRARRSCGPRWDLTRA
jgi:hypothetical protein